MEMSPLERAARALYVRESPPTDHYAWEDIEEAERDHYRANVRAVLQAIREPTSEMLSAGNITIPAQDDCTPCFEYDLGEYEAQKVWQAMIDRALSE